MANENQQVSGSTQVNPTPQTIPIKDSAIHHKDLGSKPVKEIIQENNQADTDPEPVELQPDN